MKPIATILFVIITLSLYCSNLFAVEYGDTYLLATNKYFTQQTSNMGKQIARDPQGGTHIVWTDGEGSDLFSQRDVWYVFCDDDSGSIQDQIDAWEFPFSQTGRSGYINVDLLHYVDEDFQIDEYIATCYYYADSKAYMGVDFQRGAGAFNEFAISRGGMVLGLAPKGTVSPDYTIHLTSSLSDVGSGDHSSFDVTLWNVTPTEGIWEWDISDDISVESCTGVSQRIQASRTSSKVALAWHHNLIGVPADEEWQGTTAHSLNNDLYIYESPDGEDWDFDEAYNVTSTIPVNRDLDEPFNYGDTLRPYDDVDLIYVDDVLHAVFTTRGFKMDIYNDNTPPVESYTVKESLIWHWDSETDTLTLVADGWYENEAEIGALHSNVNRPSIGADEDGNLYCIFRQVTEEDQRDSEVCAGEIMLSISEDGGETWSEGINLTGSVNTEEDGDYHDENFPSLAEYVDDDLHIFYAVIADETTEDTPYRMIYHRVPVGDLPEVDPLPMPRDDFQYHNGSRVHVSDSERPVPLNLALTGVYPNPFNSSTRISYTVPASGEVTLKLFEISGREVALLESGYRQAGRFEYSLDGAGMATGIYLVRLTQGQQTVVSKLLLVK
ncbi:T9SS type A sorting domain-containing protein [Calditrichota bacterium]